jgi:hypothetical protein
VAFPTNLIQNDGFAQSGIILGLHPSSDTTFDLRLQRQDTGTTWRSVQVWQGGAYDHVVVYRDLLPNDHLRRDYRARHEKSGYTAGAWTDTVSGGPAVLPPGDPPFIPVSGRRLTLPTYLSTSATLAIRTSAGAAGAVAKSMTLPAAELLPSQSTNKWAFNVAYVSPLVASAALIELYGSVVLPPGVTVTGVNARMYRSAAGKTAVTQLIKISETGTATVLCTLTHSTTNWQTVASSAMSELTTGAGYTLQVGLKSTAGSGGDARFLRATIAYSMPSYDKAL